MLLYGVIFGVLVSCSYGLISFLVAVVLKEEKKIRLTLSVSVILFLSVVIGLYLLSTIYILLLYNDIFGWISITHFGIFTLVLILVIESTLIYRRYFYDRIRDYIVYQGLTVIFGSAILVYLVSLFIPMLGYDM